MTINIDLLEPITAKPFFKEILEKGGQPFFIGGAVRDMFLEIEPKDIDICVRLIPYQNLSEILSKHGKVDLVGESFGVIKFKEFETNLECEIALPRVDSLDKSKKGHTAILAQSDHLLDIESDLKRRDFSVNSFAISHTFKLIDPFHGVDDLKLKIIRATDKEAFVDDPLRMLRCLQLASRLSFAIEPHTLDLIKSHKHLIKDITPERILMEFQKVIDKKGDHIIFLDLLDETGLWEEMFGFKMEKDYITIQPTTVAELLFFTIDFEPSLASNVADFFEMKLKIDNKTYKELDALSTARGSRYNINIPLARYITFSILRRCPWIFDLPSFKIKDVDKEDFLSGKYPMSYKDIKISGDELVSMGYEGRACGEMLNKILEKIFNDTITNDSDSIKIFIINGI